MLRHASRGVVTRASTLLWRPRSIKNGIRRHQSTSSSGSSGGRIALTGIVAATGLLGGTLGYASLDNDFRKTVEDSLPGAKAVFDSVLGETSESAKPVPKKADEAPPSKLRATTTPPPRLPQPPLPPLPDIEKPLSKADVAPSNKLTKVAEVAAKKEQQRVSAERKNNNAELVEFNFALEEACKDLESKTSKAVRDGEACIQATRDHMAMVRAVMDDDARGDPARDDNKAWGEVVEAAAKKSEAIKAANRSLDEAKAAASRAVEKIEIGRKNKTMQDSESLKRADATAGQAVGRLERVVTMLDSSQREAQLVEEYRSLVEEGRQQFQKEIEAILPDSQLGQKAAGSLTEDELNVFMTHAYRKVCQLQQELARLQTIEKQRPPSASGQPGGLQSELDTQRMESEVEYHRKLASIRDEMEKEMRTQLRRQAAAHADHISDVLGVQSQELARVHARKVSEVAAEAKASHDRELAKIKGSLSGLEKAIEDRAFVNNASVESQQLWLACAALHRELGANDGPLVDLGPKVKAIEEAVSATNAFGSDEFVKALLDAIPERARTAGVASEAEIRGRFGKVAEMAKRTALVGDGGGSLLLYALSYVQSLLVASPSSFASMPGKDDLVDVDSLSTFDVVWLAKASLDRGDVGQAVRYMNLLGGEPRRQAVGWINDARTHLEVGQISQALLSYASAVGAEAVPASKQ